MSLLGEALEAYQAGYTPFRAAADGSKRPLGEWKAYQADRPSEDQVIEWFGNGHQGIGLIMGAVSGNAEMLEFEGRAVDEGLLARWSELMNAAGLRSLRERLRGWVERSPSGGYHIHYRVDGPVPGNTKLAQRPPTDAELEANPKQKVYPLIETRGEGGFVVVAPSSGPVHPSGQPWVRIAGGPTAAPKLTVDEHQALHEACRLLDQMPEPEPQGPMRDKQGYTDDTLRPGDNFNVRAAWDEILPPHGWTRLHTDRDGTTYWRRPGKDRDQSATTGRNDGDNLYVFSTSTEFDAEKAYSKFAAYTLLNHRGDYATAARALRGLGYGEDAKATVISVDKPTKPTPYLPDEFWTARPILEHIRQAAWSRGRSAEAVLGAVITRVAADTNHVLKLPATVGARCGLSLIVALTGPPGSGKSSSKGIAVELTPARLIEPVCDDVPPGSGEGALEILFEFVTEVDPDSGKTIRIKRQTRHNAFIYADEGEILAVQARRNTANTILPILRSVFTDGTLGQANASEERKRVISGGHYVYGIVLGIQPEKVASLFEDAGGGTPQRFLWMPTNTPVPPPGERPDWPGELPRAAAKPIWVGVGGWMYFSLPHEVVTEIQHNDHNKQQNGCDPLNEHADLIRLKVAAILALMDGRHDVSLEDWQLALAIRDVSDATRQHVLDGLSQQRSAANRARGEAEAERSLVAGERIEAAVAQRVSKSILRKLEAAGGDWVSGNDLKRSMWHKYRDDVEAVAESLADVGLIEIESHEYRSQEGFRYKIAKGAK